ncbi:MAG: hypothetical protein U9N84_01505 [Actinomycetota bacterium]|nr:hypothetical protein [Actinomycetota bacterium]
MKSIRSAKFVGAMLALVLVVAACGGQSAEEELLEQIFENAGEDIGDIDINTDGDGFNLNIEGEDGEDVSITGGGDDDDFEITVEGEDGGTFSFGGGDLPDGLQIPVPDGGNVLLSIEAEDMITVSLEYPGSDFDGIVGFYDSELNPDSDDVDRTESSFTTEDGDWTNVAWTSSSGDWFVNVSSCFGTESGELDGACIQISQSNS